MSVRRVLAIDGGGIKGVFPVAFLASFEETVNRPIGQFFDLIVGTSTGGIIALGLGLGFSATELLSFYEDMGSKVFPGRRLLRLARWLGFPKYSPGPLREALRAQFQERRLGESQTRLVIPSLNLETGKIHVYKTAHHERFQKDFKERVVDIALATAAAPSYFPTFWSSTGLPLIDGGLWANNPVGPAVVEAIGVLGWRPGDLRVLSLGCTTAPVDIGIGRRMGMGSLYWGMKIQELFMAGQSWNSLGTATLLTGSSNVERISPIVAAGRFSLDNPREIRSLRGLGFAEAREALPRLKSTFFSEPAEAFVPFHTL